MPRYTPVCYVKEFGAIRHFSVTGQLQEIMVGEIEAAQTEDNEYRESPELKELLALVPFEVKDEDGVIFTLERNFGTDEEIVVQVNVEETDPTAQADEMDGDEEGNPLTEHLSAESDEDQDFSAVYFTTTIKRRDTQMIFSCLTDSAEGILIESVRFAKTGEELESGYAGPNFEDLDDQLQESLYNYLVERGVGDELGNFINAYSVMKENSQYLKWLQSLQAFVQ